jgi:hypothetical protein
LTAHQHISYHYSALTCRGCGAQQQLLLLHSRHLLQLGTCPQRSASDKLRTIVSQLQLLLLLLLRAVLCSVELQQRLQVALQQRVKHLVHLLRWH